jgi:hypothetical protein
VLRPVALGEGDASRRRDRVSDLAPDDGSWTTSAGGRRRVGKPALPVDVVERCELVVPVCCGVQRRAVRAVAHLVGRSFSHRVVHSAVDDVQQRRLEVP